MDGRIDLTNNRGPLLNIAEWVSLTAVILAAASKIYVKWKMTKNLDLNDMIIGVAVVRSYLPLSKILTRNLYQTKWKGVSS